jgi:hypothetical protein
MNSHQDVSHETMTSWASRIPFTSDSETEKPHFTSETEIIVVRRRNSITLPIRPAVKTPSSPTPHTPNQTRKSSGGTSNTSHQRRKSIALPTSISNQLTTHQLSRTPRAISPTSRLLSPTVASTAGRYRWHPAVNLGYVSPTPSITQPRNRRRASTQTSEDAPVINGSNGSARGADANGTPEEITQYKARERGLLREAQEEFVDRISVKVVGEGEEQEGGGGGGEGENNIDISRRCAHRDGDEVILIRGGREYERGGEDEDEDDDDDDEGKGEEEDGEDEEDEGANDIDRARVLRYAESRSRRPSNPFDDSFALEHIPPPPPVFPSFAIPAGKYQVYNDRTQCNINICTNLS